MNDPLKKYRRRLHLWNNVRKLQKERRDYTAMFQKRGLRIPDDKSLKNELQKSFPGIKPKPKGSINSLVIYHHYNWESYSLKPALQRFGPVRHYDWFEEFNHSRKDWRGKGKVLMNRALIERVSRWMTEEKADFIFMYVSGELVEPETLSSLRSFGIPMVNLALNDKEHFVSKIRSGRAFGARDICRWFDLCWTSTEDALIKYCVEGARPIYMPEGANPDIHKPYDVEKTFDVSFVGQCYGNRAMVIDELIRRGISAKAYGIGWPAGPLTVDDMVKLYSRSRINLGFGGVEGHRDTFCLKGRDFEIPMSGGLYLTEDHPELANAFQPGDEILTYSGINDLAQTICHYLAHPDQADRIRKKGRERALRDHTWEARFAKIFRLMGLLE